MIQNPFQNPQGSVTSERERVAKQILKSIDIAKKQCAANLIFNSKKELLLLQRSPDDSFWPNTWCLPGGGMDDTETAKTACVRETKEEIGLYIPNVTATKIVKLNDVDIYYFASMISEDSEAFIMLDEKEHQKYKFCKVEDWLGLDLILSLKQHLCEMFGIDPEVYELEKAVVAEEGDGEKVDDEEIDENGEDESNENGKGKKDDKEDSEDDIKKAFEDLDIEKAEFSGKERKKLAKECEAEKGGSYPIRNASDLSNAISAFGRSKDKVATKTWIKKRAKELGLEDSLPESWSKKKNDIEKSFDDLLGEDYLEKAEGSRGGKIIGHTKSGKAIYENSPNENHKDFTSSDHANAKDKHEKIAMKHNRDKNNSGFSRDKRMKSAQKEIYHMDQANDHADKAHNLKQEEKKTDANKKARDSAEIEQIERARNVATSKDSSEEDKKKAKKFLDDKKDNIEKGGPGSGKKKGDNSPDKGKTLTGKHISHLEGSGHPMYENFTSSEHKEAAEHLKKKGSEHFSEAMNHKMGTAEHDAHSSEGERLQKLSLTHTSISNSKKKNEEDKKRLKKSFDNEFENLIN